MSRQQLMGRQHVVAVALLLLFVMSVGVLQGYRAEPEPKPIPNDHFIHREPSLFERGPNGMSLGVEKEEEPAEAAVSQALTTYLQTQNLTIIPNRQTNSESTNTTCQQLLNNTTLDAIIEDNVAFVEPWVPLIDIAYVDSANYTSPTHSFVLVDQDPGDPSPENDAFGQGFVMPNSLTSVTIEYNTAMLNANVNDQMVGALWLLSDDGSEYEEIAYDWTVSDELNQQWEGRFVEITDQDILELMEGRNMVFGFISFSDNQNEAEEVFFDDITITACSNPPTGDAFLPLVMRDNRVNNDPICRPPTENPRDHWDRHRGLTETNAVCNSNLSLTDTRDYYTFTPTSVNGQHTFHLRNLPPNTEWSILVYEERGGQLPELAPGPTAGTCRIGTPGSQNKAVSCQLRTGQVYIVKVSGGAYSGAQANYQMEVSGPVGNVPTPTPTPVSTATPTPTNTPTPTPTVTPTATNTPIPTGDLQITNDFGGVARVAIAGVGTQDFDIGVSTWDDIPAGTYQVTFTALTGPCQGGGFDDSITIQSNQTATYSLWCTAQTIENGDFENGATGWTQFSSNGFALIGDTTFLPASIPPHSGSWAVWLGGAANETSYIEQQVFVLPRLPILSYWHWISSGDSCGSDLASVRVDGNMVDSYDLCSDMNTNGWSQRFVDLSSFVNQTVTIQIRAETNSSLNSSLYIDDVFMQETMLNNVPTGKIGRLGGSSQP